MRRCPLCHERPTAIGWCGACRQSYRQRGIARANVMETAEWGAERARQGARSGKRFAAILEGTAAAPSTEQIAQRFARLWVLQGLCWIWQGSQTGQGYGRISRDRRVHLAHRVSWELHRGPIPPGMCVLHDCPGGDNPSCVNPEHLWLGTKLDHSDDMIAKGRQVILRGEKIGGAKLTEDQVRAIREAAAAGMTEREICERFGISKGTRYHIVKRLQWKHVA